jgi:hypothetical protein
MSHNANDNAADRSGDHLESHEKSSKPPESSAASGMRFGRILAVVFPLALLAMGLAAFFAWGGPEWLTELTRPALVPVEGRVLHHGAPVAGALVTTRPAKRNRSGAIAVTDESGRFQLKTDVEGTLTNGAYPGVHKVTLVVHGPPPGGAAPPPVISPPEYASFDRTPVTIEVQSQPNEFDLVIEGEIQASQPTDPSRAPTRAAPDSETDEKVNSADSGADPIETPQP